MSAEGSGAAMTEVVDPIEHFEQFRNSFFLDIERRKQEHQELQAQLEKYKHENAVLQAQLDARAANDQARHENSDALPRISDENAAVPYATYAKLREQQEITWQSLKVSHQALERYKVKYQKAKDSIRPWREYANRCEERLAQRVGVPASELGTTLTPLQRPSEEPSDLSSSRPSSADLDTITKPRKSTCSRSSSITSPSGGRERILLPKTPSKLRTTILAHSPEIQINAIKLQADGIEAQRSPPLHISADRLSAPGVAIGASYVTDDEPRSDETADTEDHLKQNSNCVDSTVISSQRTYPSVPADLQSRTSKFQHDPVGGSPLAPIQIKSEPGSSPIMHATASEIHRPETLDLDEIGTHIATPRKFQRIRPLFPQSSSFSFPPTGARSSQLFGDETNVSAYEDTKNQEVFQSPKLRQHKGLGASETIFATCHDRVRGTGSPALQPEPRNHYQSAESHNNRHLAIPRKRKHELTEHIGSVTEDGDADHRSFRPTSSSKKLKANRAIQVLLNDSTPAKKTLISPSAGTTARQQRPPLADIATPTVRKGGGTRANNAPSNLQLPTPQTDSPRRKSPEERPSRFKRPLLPPQTPATRYSPRKCSMPLRHRQLADLQPEDFKLNPRSHGNLDLTTTESVRNHEDRRHLHGCTDTDCAQCGQAMRVLAAELPITVGSSLFASTEDERLTDEERLLKHHLGDSFDQARIARMDPAERAELVMQAKVQIVAERSGRHRLRPNARAKTPPGFWDVEMPTTQDMEERAREVERRTKEVVKERHREAMRPGGRWLFKDE